MDKLHGVKILIAEEYEVEIVVHPLGKGIGTAYPVSKCDWTEALLTAGIHKVREFFGFFQGQGKVRKFHFLLRRSENLAKSQGKRWSILFFLSVLCKSV